MLPDERHPRVSIHSTAASTSNRTTSSCRTHRGMCGCCSVAEVGLAGGVRSSWAERTTERRTSGAGLEFDEDDAGGRVTNVLAVVLLGG